MFNVLSFLFCTVIIKALCTLQPILYSMRGPNILRLTATLLERNSKLDYSSFYQSPLMINCQIFSQNLCFHNLLLSKLGLLDIYQPPTYGGYCTMIIQLKQRMKISFLVVQAISFVLYFSLE